ncbi:MAG: hypothetical protein HFI48_01595 [Lachnospiraceae bacterium]|nr:hypothetical protein [Lachnospiraceae bacterium]
MKKWLKAALFVLPLLVMVAAVNWYVDSYAYLRVTYDEIAGKMIRESRNVVGLEESNFNDRSLLAACLKMQDGPREVVVLGSSRVLTFEHTMFGTDSFYNAGLSESTIYDLLAVTGILAQEDKLPETMIIGVDSFLFNAAHNNDRWLELEPYEIYMEELLGRESAADRKDINAAEDGKDRRNAQDAGKTGGAAVRTGRDNTKWLSLDYFRYNVTCLPKNERFLVSYTGDHEGRTYIKHYDGSIAYQEELRSVEEETVIAMTKQAMDEQVVYRMTDYRMIDADSMELLAGLIDYLKGEGVEVILYLPPYSPMLYDYIESTQHYRITLEVEEAVKTLAAEKGTALYGSFDPAGSGLAMTDLYDVYHVKTEKTMDTFFPVLEAE